MGKTKNDDTLDTVKKVAEVAATVGTGILTAVKIYNEVTKK